MGVVHTEVIKTLGLESYDDTWRILVTKESEDGGYVQNYLPTSYISYFSARQACHEIEIDGDCERHKQYLEDKEIARQAKIEEQQLYRPNKGNFAFVARSSRKHKGKCGFIFWFGSNKFGYRNVYSVGIETLEGEKIFVNDSYVDCFPTPEPILDLLGS